jgi:hypothetical protein
VKLRVLSAHFGSVKTKLLEYSRHFDIADHGDIKGYGREALVGEFLQSHLPDQVEYLTGEILDEDDNRSGQTDIILQSKRFPKIPLLGSTHLVLADSVMAVIEVKSNLNKQHLNAALAQFQKIKALKRQTSIEGRGPMRELNKTPCIIFAFKGLSHEKIIDHINAYALSEKVSLNDFAPDMVVVLDSDHYICRNDGWIFPIIPKPGAFFRTWIGLPNENLVGLYQYLFSISQSFLFTEQTFGIAPYFDKSILK